jgi:hypothetical protein
LRTRFATYFFVPEADLLELFVHPLREAGINYLVSGSMAAMLYGEPRVTHDVDLLVLLKSEDIPQLSRMFPATDFYLPPPVVIAVEMTRERRGRFNVIHPASGLKADFYLVNRDELHTWAFRNKRTYQLSGRTITLAPPEYVIVRKLEFFREGGSEKHLRDIRSMLAISGEQIDHLILQDWIKTRELSSAWSRVTEH